MHSLVINCVVSEVKMSYHPLLMKPVLKLIEFRGNKFLVKGRFRERLISYALLDIVKGGS